jgi:hypothetical protein
MGLNGWHLDGTAYFLYIFQEHVLLQQRALLLVHAMVARPP